MSTTTNLLFTAAGKERLAEIHAFLDKLNSSASEHAAAIQQEFFQRLAYLDDFGGTSDDGTRPYRVTLGRDFADLSFTLVWERWNPSTETYEYAFNGGLIWHGGPNDPLTVSLTPQWWGIHT